MFTYNKKVRLKPYEGIPLADFNVEPDAPPLRMIVRPGKMFPSHSRTDLTRTKEVVAPMNLRRPKSAMDLSRDPSQGFQSRNSYYPSDSPTDEIAESSRELIECLPKMTAVKHDKKDSDKKDSLSLDTPATGNRDCVTVYPQNTVPMAKYRKKISGELPDSDDEEAPMTDAQRWSKEKMALEITHNPRRRRKASLWANPDPDESMAFDLDDQIKKPTYMGDESMDSENLTSVLTKGSRRKSLVAIGNVVAKLAKRRQSNIYEEGGDSNNIISAPSPRRPTVVTFDVPDDQDGEDGGSRASESSLHSAYNDNELTEAPTALPPAQFMDTKTMISLSENLVSKIANDRRTPANALDFPLPVAATHAFSLATIPEVDRPLTASSRKSDGPIFIRPPETPFEKSDDITSDDDMSSASRPKRHSSRSSYQRHRSTHRNSIGGNSGDYDDTELDKERTRSRRRNDARRKHSSKKDLDEKNRIRKRKSGRKSRRRGSDVRERVGLDHLDRAKNDQQSDEPVEDNSFLKFASFFKGNEPKTTNLSRSESFALENIARKIISLVQQNGDINIESNDSDAALIQNRGDSAMSSVVQHRINVTSDTPIQQTRSVEEMPFTSPPQVISAQSPHVQPTNSAERQLQLEQADVVHPVMHPNSTANPVTVIKPDDLSSSNIFEPRDGDPLKTVVRLPTLLEQPGENEEILRKRVEDFLNGNSEEGDSHFQQVPGRRWVAEWARREEVINPNRSTPENIENKKIKRKRSSLSRKRSIKRSPSTASIGTFFSRIFNRLRVDEEPVVTKTTEVVACVYTVRMNESGDNPSRPVSSNIHSLPPPVTNLEDNPIINMAQTSRAAQKVTFLDDIANSKDSGVFSEKGFDSVDENSRFQIKGREISQSRNVRIAQQ